MIHGTITLRFLLSSSAHLQHTMMCMFAWCRRSCEVNDIQQIYYIRARATCCSNYVWRQPKNPYSFGRNFFLFWVYHNGYRSRWVARESTGVRCFGRGRAQSFVRIRASLWHLQASIRWLEIREFFIVENLAQVIEILVEESNVQPVNSPVTVRFALENLCI